MKTKLLSALLSLAALSPVALRAQTATAPAPVEAPGYSVVLTPNIVTEYMFRGVRLGGNSFQPSVEFDSGNLALGVWANFPLSAKVAGVSDPEVDPYGSYTFAVNDTLSIVPGFTWYNYPDAEKSAGFYTSTFEPSVAVNYTIGGVKLTPKLYYDMVLEGATYELTGTFAYPLKNLGTELDFTGTVGTYLWNDAVESSDPRVKNWGDYWLAGVSIPIVVGKHTKFVIGYAYTKGSNNYYKTGSAPKVRNTAAEGNSVVTIGYTITL